MIKVTNSLDWHFDICLYTHITFVEKENVGFWVQSVIFELDFLLIEIIRILSPSSPERKEAYKTLIELGFVETTYKG